MSKVPEEKTFKRTFQVEGDDHHSGQFYHGTRKVNFGSFKSEAQKQEEGSAKKQTSAKHAEKTEARSDHDDHDKEDHSIKEKATALAQNANEKVGEVVENAKEEIQQKIHKTQEYVSDNVAQAKKSVSGASDKIEELQASIKQEGQDYIDKVSYSLEKDTSKDAPKAKIDNKSSTENTSDKSKPVNDSAKHDANLVLLEWSSSS